MSRIYPDHAPEPLPADPPAMRQAIQGLKRLGIEFVLHTRWQIKIGNLNFYPNKGTIFLDGQDKARPERGLPALLDLLRAEDGQERLEISLS